MNDDIIVDKGIELKMEPPLPRIDVSQAEASQSSRYAAVEIMGRDFPWEDKKINKHIVDPRWYAIQASLNYRLQGWCLFEVIQSDLQVERLTIRDQLYLNHVIQAVFEAITFTPNQSICRNPMVTVLYPLHEMDRPVPQELLKQGWDVGGQIPDYFEGYGSEWEAIKLVKQF